MPDFTDSLNKALKYHQEAERASFDKAIEDNPIDATTHGAYADWLDEHGEPEEAAFRRSMGEWHQNNDYSQTWPVEYDPSSRYVQWLVHKRNTPAGVDAGYLPEENYLTPTGRYKFKDNRDMEQAFRKAFQAGRHIS